MHGFLGARSRSFAHFHPPAVPARRMAYLLCPPIGYEAVHCHNSLRALAEALAAQGFPTLRLEYDGTGEAPGFDTDPGRVAAWLGSIHEALRTLRACAGVESVGVVGLRMGATLALQAAREQAISSLVLWEPCASGAAFAREMEIMASAAVAAGEDEAANGLQAGGYRYTAETLGELRQLDLRQVHPLGQPRVLIALRDDRKPRMDLAEPLTAAGAAVEVEQLPGYPAMMGGGHAGASVVPGAALSRIVEWAMGAAGATRGGSGPPPVPQLAAGCEADGIRREVRRFGPGQRLFGVLYRPAVPPAAPLPAVLMLTGGVVPRTGANRMYVELAGRLALSGHAVLRMDISGIAESAVVEGQQPNELFPPSLLGDARLALEEIAASEVWLVGLCSGATAAFAATLAETRVIGAVLINPPMFELQDGVAADPMLVKQFEESRYYRSALFRPSSWARLLSGRVDLRKILRLVRTRATTELRGLRAKFLNRAGLAEEGLEADLGRLLRRGVNVNLAFSQVDHSLEGFQHRLGSALRALEQRGLEVRVFVGADNTFGPLRPREELLGWIMERMAARARRPPTPG